MKKPFLFSNSGLATSLWSVGIGCVGHLKAYPIETKWSAIGFGYSVRTKKNDLSMDLVIEEIEKVVWFCLHLQLKLPLKIPNLLSCL